MGASECEVNSSLFIRVWPCSLPLYFTVHTSQSLYNTSIARLTCPEVKFKKLYSSTRPKMVRRDSGIARRAWDALRLALLWARRGRVFRRHLAVKLRLAAARFARSVAGGRGSAGRDRICYGERELSFDETPVFHVKMHRPGRSVRSRFSLPRIPCINPDVDFDYAFDDDEDGGECGWERKNLVADGEHLYYEGTSESSEEEEINVRAEEFIAKFYEQMKLQRQISYLQYTEMLSRATS